KTTTVKARAFQDGFTPSQTATATITISLTLLVPTITPDRSPPYKDTVKVQISVPQAGARIYYSLDGSEPTTKHLPYVASIPLTKTITVTARAFQDGFESSPTAAATFTVTPTLASPIIGPDGGTFTDSVTVQIGTSPAGPSIFYTLDGSEPTRKSTRYS